ncbi:hypothetical protein GWO13_11275 [Candidatus Bathyarchaeota archaeon]|nr:hypothetical protein [Candidatus Bathyarchaeota archaeon]
MTEYLVLLKVDPKKIVNTIRALRDLPEKPGPGVGLQYVMNVFGTWDVAMWFNTDSYDKAVDFVDKNISQNPGVVDVYTVPTFPNIKPKQVREAATKDEPKEEPTEKPTEKNEAGGGD